MIIRAAPAAPPTGPAPGVRGRSGLSGSMPSTHGTLPEPNGRPRRTPSTRPPRPVLLPHPEGWERPPAGAGGCPLAGAGGPVGGRAVLLAAAAALAVVAAGSGYAVVRGGPATRDYPAASLAGTLFAGPAGPKAQPGQGISQPMRRVASFGGTVVAVGSQTGGDIPRAQFFVSRDDGTTWRLAAVTAPGGGAPAPGHAAQLITHGRTGWLATGPDGIWTSTSGRSWTLASTSGITPADAGDQTSVLISTGRGYLAAGQNAAEGTAVIWTSADGLHWQRMAAPQLGMPSGSGVVTDITGAAAGGGGILLSGHIATTTVQSHGTGSQTVVTRTPAVWLSTDDGVTWTLAPVPVSHGATNGLAGIAADGTGFVAVRPGNVPAGPNAQPDGVVYASANGTSWRYVSTLTSASGVQIGMVAGGPGGFAALGRGPGGYMAAFLSADGLSWRSGISFGPAPASVTGATVTAAGTVLVTGARGAVGSQRPYLALAQPGQSARAVNVAAVPGATVPQLSLNAVAVYRNQRVAVGEAGGLPAIWSAAGRSWSPVSWSSSPGSGAGTPSASAPSASHSSTSGSSTSGLPASGSLSPPACPPAVDVRPIRVRLRLTRGGSVRLTLARRVRFARSVRDWFTLARRVRFARRVRDRFTLARRVRLRRSLCPFRHLRRPRRQRRRRRPAADQRGARPGGLAGDR